MGICVEGSAASIADAITEIERGGRDLAGLGASLRGKALNELDYSKIAHSLSAEYSRVCAIPAPMAATASTVHLRPLRFFAGVSFVFFGVQNGSSLFGGITASV